ncbi:MAG: AtpZ/AtpI family protein [Phycisphaeraceae bacterium]
MPGLTPGSMKFAAAGTELAGAVVVPIIAGIGYDRWQDTLPWGLLIGVGLGLILGTASLIKTIQKARIEANRSHPPHPTLPEPSRDDRDDPREP